MKINPKKSKIEIESFYNPEKLLLYKEDHLLENYSYFFKKKHERMKEVISVINSFKGGWEEFTSAYNYFGFTNNKKDESLIYFREWLPGAKEVFLVGDFNGWNITSHPLKRNDFGVYKIKLRKNEIEEKSKVKLYIKTEKDEFIYRNPAYAKRLIADEKTKVYDALYIPQENYLMMSKNPKIPIKPKIYEIHIGMAEEKEQISTFKDFIPRLAEIKTAGYNIIQIMPISEHVYYGSFGYLATNLYAISSRFGEIEDFVEFMDKAHDMGLAVILDLVHSHTSSNHLDGLANMDGTGHLYTNKYHYAWNSQLFDLSKTEVLRYLLSNIRYFIEEFQVDGFRFDGITSMLYTHHGLDYTFTGNYNEYFNDFLDIESWVYLTFVNFLLKNSLSEKISIAEDVSGFPGLCRSISEGGVGFDYRLNMYIPDMWIKIIKENYWDLDYFIFNLKNKRKFEKVINYSESHDQALVGDKTISMRLFDKLIYTNMSVLNEETHEIFRGIFYHKFIRFITMFFGDGYMNFMGNEFGHPEWIDFPREGNNWSFKYCRRQWSLKSNQDLRYKFLDFFDKEMLRLDCELDIIGKEEFYYIEVRKLDRVFSLENNDYLLVFNLHESNSYDGYQINCFADHLHCKIFFDSDNKKLGGHGRLDEGYKVEFEVFGKQQENENNEKNAFIKIYLPSLSFIIFQKY